MDLRTQKTYDALAEAFTELLTQQPFEDITVNGLCERARVRRATFYNHFADKYAFLEFMVKRIRDQENEVIQDKTRSGGPGDFFITLLNESLTFIESNRAAIRNLQSASSAAFLVSTDTAEMSHYVRDKLQSFSGEGYELPGDPEVLAEFLVGAVGQIGRWWFETDGRISKGEAVARLTPILATLFPDSAQ